MNISGLWQVVDSHYLVEEYLAEDAAAHVQLVQHGDRIDGEFHINLLHGEIDGRVHSPNLILFSFEGMDEMDPITGSGTITMRGQQLIFTLMIHMGDDIDFHCVRQEE